MIKHDVVSIANAHATLMKAILWTHTSEITDDGEISWEYPESISIDILDPLRADSIHPSSSFQQARCDEYAKQLIHGVQNSHQPNENFAYTYHERLFLESQYDDVLQRLRDNPSSRRAVLYTWLPAIDNKSDEVPCLQSIQLLIRNNRLNALVYMRSNDVLSAFGPNAYGLVRLLGTISLELEVPMGTYTHIIGSPHLYPIRDKADLQRWL